MEREALKKSLTVNKPPQIERGIDNSATEECSGAEKPVTRESPGAEEPAIEGYFGAEEPAIEGCLSADKPVTEGCSSAGKAGTEGCLSADKTVAERGIDESTAKEWLVEGRVARERAVDNVATEWMPSEEKPVSEEGCEMERQVPRHPPPLVLAEHLPVGWSHAGVAECW